MPCKKGTKQTSQEIIDKIIKEHENGITKKDLAIKYNKPFGTSTYAVGSEGLAPGESSTFRMSVDKNSKIRDCSVSIYDYD